MDRKLEPQETIKLKEMKESICSVYCPNGKGDCFHCMASKLRANFDKPMKTIFSARRIKL